MILDTLAHSRLYLGYHPRLAAAFDFLNAKNLSSLTAGRHPIQGDDLFALVNLYETKPASQCAWEAHRKYIDVQYMVEGAELMGCAPLEDLQVSKPYDEKSDCLFLSGGGGAPGAPATTLRVNAGSYAIFAPHDAHMPCIAIDGQPGKVRKIVVKIRL